jgi:hypothetical protein
MMSEDLPDDVARELDALRSENARLRVELDEHRFSPRPAPPSAPHRGRWRAFVSALSIAVGVVLAPAALVAAWASTEMAVTAQFVDTLAPLARNPAVLDYVSDEVSSAIDSSLDIDEFTDSVFTGLANTDLPPRVSAALGALSPAAADGIRSMLADVVNRAVHAPAFREVWTEALRASHEQVIAVLEDDRSGALVVDDDGAVGLRLAPIIERVKTQLANSGFPLADQIPVVDRTVALTTIEGIAPARTAYRLLVWLSTALPIAVIVFVGVGILVARNRPLATLLLGLALTVTFAAFVTALLIARTVLITAAADKAVPRPVTSFVFDSLTTTMSSRAIALALLGLVLATIGFLSGRSAQAVAVRSVALDLQQSAFGFLYERGLVSERFGDAVFAARAIIRWVILALALLILVLARPLTPGLVVGTALGAAVVLLVVSLFQRAPQLLLTPPEPHPATGAAVSS